MFDGECYRPTHVMEGNGVLTLNSTASPCMGMRYSSGAVQWRSFNFTYGTLEFFTKEPRGIAHQIDYVRVYP